jgi:uncharacterized protein DUF4192
MTDDDVPVFTAHDIPDLINTLPTLFGFRPEDSIVAVATSGPRHRVGFRLRMDMPAMVDVERAAAHVVAHLAHQGAEGAMIIAVTPQTEVAARLVPAIERRLGPIRPVMGAWADGERYWTTFEDCAPEAIRTRRPSTTSPSSRRLPPARRSCPTEQPWWRSSNPWPASDASG